MRIRRCPHGSGWAVPWPGGETGGTALEVAPGGNQHGRREEGAYTRAVRRVAPRTGLPATPATGQYAAVLGAGARPPPAPCGPRSWFCRWPGGVDMWLGAGSGPRHRPGAARRDILPSPGVLGRPWLGTKRPLPEVFEGPLLVRQALVVVGHGLSSAVAWRGAARVPGRGEVGAGRREVLPPATQRPHGRRTTTCTSGSPVVRVRVRVRACVCGFGRPVRARRCGDDRWLR